MDTTAWGLPVRRVERHPDAGLHVLDDPRRYLRHLID